MNERDQKIVEAIENLPAIFGKNDQKKKAISIARSKIGRGATKIFYAESCWTLAERESKLTTLIDEVKTELLGDYLDRLSNYSGQAWFKVKAGKGKSEKSCRCKIDIFKGAPCSYTPSPEQGTSSFYAPVSMIYVDTDGQSWLPVFFVKQKLAELQERASYRVGRYERVAAQAAQWPGAGQYFDQLKKIFPSEKEIQSAIEEKKIETAKLEAKEESDRQLQEELEEKRKKEAAAAVKREEKNLFCGGNKSRYHRRRRR
jgi:hypothetical protein